MYDVSLSESHFPLQADIDLRDMTVGSILRDAAADTPDAPALLEIDEDGSRGRSWTYAELLAESEELAHALLTRFEPGERIVVWANNIPEWIVCEFAFGLAGIVLVTANPGYQPRELKYVIDQSGAVGLFLVESFRGNPMGKIGRDVAARCPAIREVTDLKDRDALFAAGPEARPLPEVSPADIAQIQYTSGSTGFPKGVLLHHHGLTNNARITNARMVEGEHQRALMVAPLFHAIACAIQLLSTIQARGQIVLPPCFDPALANRIIESEKIEFASLVPTMLVMMLEHDDHNPRDLTSLEMIGSGGAMVPAELVRKVTERTGCKFTIGYGMTETSPMITGTFGDDTIEDQTTTIGQPFAQMEVSIRDPASNEVMPLDTVGEICVRGYNVMRGYNDNPEATAQTIDADGWMHTGDLGTMDARGYMRITGRVKEMIIRGGENLFPVEIENAIFEHPDVAQVAVVGVPDEKWGEIPVAFVKPVEGRHVDPDALKAHLRTIIAAQKTPAKWIEVGDFPMTGSGKIQKFHLRDAYLDGKYGEV